MQAVRRCDRGDACALGRSGCACVEVVQCRAAIDTALVGRTARPSSAASSETRVHRHRPPCRDASRWPPRCRSWASNSGRTGEFGGPVFRLSDVTPVQKGPTAHLPSTCIKGSRCHGLMCSIGAHQRNVDLPSPTHRGRLASTDTHGNPRSPTSTPADPPLPTSAQRHPPSPHRPPPHKPTGTNPAPASRTRGVGTYHHGHATSLHPDLPSPS